MTHRTLLTLALVVLFVAPGLSVAAVNGSPELSVQFSDGRVVPGEETTLDLVIVNEGDLTQGSTSNPSLNSDVTKARGMTARIESDGAPFTVLTGKQAVGTLPEGASDPISFNVAVDANAEPGTYSVPVTVSYKYTSYISEGDGTRDQETVTETLRTKMTVEDGAVVDVVGVDSGARVGSTGTVAVTVENAGTQTANRTRLTMTSLGGATVFGESDAATKYLGTWEPGERKTVRYRVTAAETAKVGEYPFTLSAAYQGNDDRNRETANVRVGVNVTREQRFTVVSTDSAVSVGDSGDYEVTLRNAGPEDVTDASVEFTAGSAALTFGESESTSRFLGNWSAGETRTMTVETTAAENADPRRYALDAMVSYEDPEGDDGTEDGLSLGVDVAPEQSFAIDDVTSTLRVGDEGRLSGVLTNTGERAVRNVVLTWEGEQQNVNPTETEYAVGRLEPGELAEFDFEVEVSDAARSGPRQFSFVAEYDNEAGEQRSTDPIAVRQQVAPARDEFDVEVVNASVEAGGSSRIELRVTNAGNETLTDVSAKLFADSPLSVSDDEAYVPSLEPGESTTFVFGIGAGGGALEKTYPLSMDFQYDEPDGDTVTSDTYRVPVAVQRPSGGGLPITIIGGIGLLAVVAVGGFVRFR